MAKKRYVSQWYESDESATHDHAATPDEELWQPDKGGAYDAMVTDDKEAAIKMAKSWKGGHFKTSRVIEIDGDGNPVSVVWMSVWETPVEQQTVKAGGGTTGYAVKLMVQLDKDWDDPSHWDWREMIVQAGLGKLADAVNARDVAYVRQVSHEGRLTMYSIKLNLYTDGLYDLADPQLWPGEIWYGMFGKDPELQANEVEFVRANPIDAHSFPDGVDVLPCEHCGRLCEQTKMWRSYDPDTEKDTWFCSCLCIDQHYEDYHPNWWRVDPDGEEHEACVHEESKVA